MLVAADYVPSMFVRNFALFCILRWFPAHLRRVGWCASVLLAMCSTVVLQTSKRLVLSSNLFVDDDDDDDVVSHGRTTECTNYDMHYACRRIQHGKHLLQRLITYRRLLLCFFTTVRHVDGSEWLTQHAIRLCKPGTGEGIRVGPGSRLVEDVQFVPSTRTDMLFIFGCSCVFVCHLPRCSLHSVQPAKSVVSIRPEEHTVY